MKKIGLLVALLAASTLSGCIFGGKGGENVPDNVAAEAIEDAKSQKLATVSRTGSLVAGVPKGIGSKAASDDEEETKTVWTNDYLYLTTSQKYIDDSGKEYTVNIEWSYADSLKSLIHKSEQVDEYHKTIYFNYSETETKDFAFKATLKCGKKSEEIDYSVNLAIKNLKFDKKSIEEIYALNSGGTDFELVNSETGFYKPNNADLSIFYFVETRGKVIYVAPDGNWALIGAGNRVMELYAGSDMDLKPEYYPALVAGKSIIVGGEATSYLGNAQISYIEYIDEDTTPSSFSGNYGTMTGAMFDGKKYFEGGIMNGLYSATVTFPSKPNVNNLVKGKRAAFNVTIDGKALTLAYDYHSDDKDASSQPVLEALKSKLSGVAAGGSLTIKGTFRFAGIETNPKNSYKGQPVGKWSLVPFLPEHV